MSASCVTIAPSLARARSQRCRDASTAWIVTSAGTASRRATTPWSAARACRIPTPSTRWRRAMPAGVTDEFVKPVVCVPDGKIRSGDSVIFMNFRPDRAREMTYVLTQSDFDGFRRKVVAQDLHYVCTTRYDEKSSIFRSRSRPRSCTTHSARSSVHTACASCASRRRKSTHTSRSSSTAARKRSIPARIACSSRRRANFRPTTSSPR